MLELPELLGFNVQHFPTVILYTRTINLIQTGRNDERTVRNFKTASLEPCVSVSN